MSETLKNIPLLFAYYLPGYLAYKLFLRLTRLKSKIEDNNGDHGICIAISLLTTAIATHCLSGASNIVISIFSILLALFLSVLTWCLWKNEKIQKIFEKATHSSLKSNIWDAVLGDKVGKQIRFYTDFNHKHAAINGIVSYYEVDDSGNCKIAINSYRVKYDDSEFAPGPEPLLIFSSENIGCIEIYES